MTSASATAPLLSNAGMLDSASKSRHGEMGTPQRVEQLDHDPLRASHAPTSRNIMSDKHTDEIVHRTLSTDDDDPAVDVAKVVAELEDVKPDELPTTYNCIDGMLDELYAEPPSPDAQMEVSFTYAGYRITVEQNGDAKFIAVD